MNTKRELLEEMERVVIEDKERVDRLKSTFLPNKKVAAITAAVGNYMSAAQSQQKQK